MIKVVPTIYLEENMSNLTSASNEASVSASSSINIISSSNMYPSPAFNQTQIQPVKRKRNQAGHPDPEAEVVALSPRTLMATNRFVCEVCNKGFQRDQNLQLHKRGHNLPWKLKQRIGNEIVRKKVYVCPESSCVHHEPSRALGDLTGIKKHFSRKHGEKKWKCERCSKKYAVLSDWKAHSKTCGTKEYRCDCGTLFSRRDSFVTHRAFCDALAEEASRSTQSNNIISQFQSNPHQLNVEQYQSQFTPIKQEQQNFNLRQEIPPWLASSPVVTGPSPVHDFSAHDPSKMTTLPPYNSMPPSPHLSATALLQKAAQMGAKTSCNASPTGLFITPHFSHVHAGESEHNSTTVGLNLSSHDEFINSLASYGKSQTGGNASLLLQGMMMNNPNPHTSSNGFGFAFDNGIINESVATTKKGNEGMTRDFLGLRPMTQSDIMNSLSNCMNKNGNNACNDIEDQG